MPKISTVTSFTQTLPRSPFTVSTNWTKTPPIASLRSRMATAPTTVVISGNSKPASVSTEPAFSPSEILDGNAADKTWNTELIGHLDEWLDLDEPPIYVADSAAFTEDTIDEADNHGIDFITRVPRTYSAVDERIDRAWEEDDWTELASSAKPVTRMTQPPIRSRVPSKRSTTTSTTSGVSSFTLPHSMVGPNGGSTTSSIPTRKTSKTRSVG